MTPVEFTKAVEELTVEYKNDPEAFHSVADDLMLAILDELGYREGCNIYKKTTKWYA